MLNQINECDIPRIGLDVYFFGWIRAIVIIHDRLSQVTRTGANGVTCQNRHISWRHAIETSVIGADDDLLAIAIVGVREQLGFFTIRGFLPAVHHHVNLIREQSLLQVSIANLHLGLPNAHHIGHGLCNLNLKANQVFGICRILKYVGGTGDVVCSPLQKTRGFESCSAYRRDSWGRCNRAPCRYITATSRQQRFECPTRSNQPTCLSHTLEKSSPVNFRSHNAPYLSVGTPGTCVCSLRQSREHALQE